MLKSLTHATVLIVSHDTGFLDAVCTDIIHYESQKVSCQRSRDLKGSRRKN